VSAAKAVVPATRAICDYCTEVYGPVNGLRCQTDDGDARHQCLVTLLQDLQEIRAHFDA